MKNDAYLIIAGAGKAGTTSLYYYLADHPAVCPSTAKEPGFFFDFDYPATKLCTYADGLQAFERLFPSYQPGQIRMEATPEYLYSSGTARRIKEMLPDAKILFSVREPVSFFISMYRFAQQLGELPNETTFEEHVAEQFRLAASPDMTCAPLPLQMGRFSTYLRPYVEAFGREHVSVVFLEDLSQDSVAVLKNVCAFCGIDPGFYETYTFRPHNRTVSVRYQGASRALNWLRQALNARTFHRPRIHALFRRLNASLLQPLWHAVNRAGTADGPPLPHAAIRRLRQFYAGEKDALEDLLNVPVPW